MSGNVDPADFTKYGKPIDADGTRAVPGLLIIVWMQRLLRWVDFIQSARALARSLAGKPLIIPHMIPVTPIVDQDTHLAAEAVSLVPVDRKSGVEGKSV